jgi:hypothetical protein
MNAVRKAVGIEKKQTVTDQILDESCPKLSYNQRLTGYVLCMSIGFILTMGSLVRLKELLHGEPKNFVIYFTFGNLCAIASCFFLSGPKSHCKKMVDPTRRIATAFYLITIFFTFFVVFYEKIPDDGRVGIIILCVFVQWVAAGKSKVHGAFVLNRRVALHAIDATPARWRGDGGSSLLDGASTAASSPSNDFHTGGSRCSGTRFLLSPSRGTGSACAAARRRATSARSTVLK